MDIYNYPISPVLNVLLVNKGSEGLTDKDKDSIIWASSNVSAFDSWYKPNSPLTEENVYVCDLRPRVLKNISDKKGRTKNHAEVFTAAWTCNKIINSCDEQWFGRKNVFNTVDDKDKKWTETDKIVFSNEDGKTWKDYIDTKFLEMTCGEAPFLVSRYDAATGKIIPIHKRIGIIDRKIRVINENTPNITKDKWINLVIRVYENTYGYEYQGDNLLVGRINLLLTFYDYYKDRWGEEPTVKELKSVAHKISWNLFQMDGFTYKVPYTELKSILYDWRSKLKVEVGTMKRIIPDESNKEVKAELKFDYVVGNPPYQGENHLQLYPDFYEQAKTIVKDDGVVCMIFPSGWQEPKTANNLSKLNKEEVKADRQIVSIDNRDDAFPGVQGAKHTNIILWKKGFDNGLNGKQLVYTNGENPEVKQLLWSKKDIDKPIEIVKFSDIVMASEGFKSIQTVTSTRKPYNLETDIFDHNEKYNLNIKEERENDSDICIYGLYSRKVVKRFIDIDKSKLRNIESIDKYKVFVPYAWGNMSESAGLGGAFSNIIIAEPNVICTETFLISGVFDTFDIAQKHSKYMMTAFFRGLLFMNKYSQHSTTSWGSIPMQTYEEDWWNKDISTINMELFKKYNIPQDIVNYVNANIQKRTESNIVNFDKGE